MIDDVIEEPLGGAHRDHPPNGRPAEDLSDQDAPRADSLAGRQLLAARYEKFRRMGVFLEGGITAAGEWRLG